MGCNCSNSNIKGNKDNRGDSISKGYTITTTSIELYINSKEIVLAIMRTMKIIIMIMTIMKMINNNSNSNNSSNSNKCTRWDWQLSIIKKKPTLKYYVHLFYTAYAQKSSKRNLPNSTSITYSKSISMSSTNIVSTLRIKNSKKHKILLSMIIHSNITNNNNLHLYLLITLTLI